MTKKPGLKHVKTSHQPKPSIQGLYFAGQTQKFQALLAKMKIANQRKKEG